MGQAHLLVGSPKAHAEDSYGSSSAYKAQDSFGDTAEDSSVLGRPRNPPEKGAKPVRD